MNPLIGKKPPLLLSAVFLFFFTGGLTMIAQNPPLEKPKDIFDALSYRKEGEGKVLIRQPKGIKQWVGKIATDETLNKEEQVASPIQMGYRIQVYNGNLPLSKQEAYRRAELVSRSFPGNACYISYKAPFWRLLLGDYTSIEEAREALAILKGVVPSIANELYVVRDKIRIITKTKE